VKKPRTSRRRFLKIAAGAGVAAGTVGLSGRSPAGVAQAAGATAAATALGDSLILLEFDRRMRLKVWQVRSGADSQKVALTRWAAPDRLVTGADSHVDQVAIDQFTLADQSREDIDGPLGRGTRLRLVGAAEGEIEKTVQVELYANYPGLALYQVSYRNIASHPITVGSWTQCALQLLHEGGAGNGVANAEPPFWSFCGSTHADRRDWVQPVRDGFEQENFMGMSAADYGGGTPIVDVWRRHGGVAIGHLETKPQLVSLPLRCAGGTVDLSLTAPVKRALRPGETLSLPQAFIATHSGDYFPVLDTYRRIMGVRGIASPQPPKAAYEPIWCAWGYERDCTLQLIEDTLPKVRELGLRWAVIDDGWQTNVGDWKVNPTKYPQGEADMRQLVQKIRSYDLQARLWWAPLAAAPGSDLLHDHTDMLLLDKDGAVQNVSWWNSFYLCPAYQPTVDYMVGLVRKFIGEWGYAGLKIDGQHLNAVAPCYNPAHRHARPEESVEKLQDFFQAVYQAATQLNPQAVVELCPCGTSYSFFNFRSFNQAPASDPESSWQVRSKGKSMKALMGPGAAFAGDHVELSAGGADFASTVGIGGIVSTKFTWPRDPKPKDSFLLTPARETVWRKWIALYNELQLPLGSYRGGLYDIGFDKPETHVIEKGGHFYYAFYARDFSGPVPLRGLNGGRYRVRDYYNDRELGEVSGTAGLLQVSFNDFLVLEARPV
jgi:alpha-galactosidase